jgi:integrase
MRESNTTKHPGVRRRADGSFSIRVTARTPEGKIVQRARVLPAGTTLDEAARASLAMRERVREEAVLSELGVALTPLPRLRDTDRDLLVTVEMYARRWFTTRRERLKPGPRDRYEDVLDNRILPRIGHLPVQDVCRAAVESWVVWVEKLRRPNGDAYAQATLDGWWRPFASLMRDLAADYGFPDPTVRIRPPRSDVRGLRESRVLTEEQLRDFLAAVHTYAPERFAEVVTVATTGMRPAEVYALKWDCVDFDKRFLVVTRGISAGTLTESTKTHAGRVVPMPPLLVEVLQAHRQRLLREQHPGLRFNLVFPGDHGGLRLPQSATKVYDLAREATKLDIRVGPQVLRRTFNTLLLREGVDRIVLRAMMGHTSEAMTQRYAGVDLKDKHKAVLRLFPGEKPGGSEGEAEGRPEGRICTPM